MRIALCVFISLGCSGFAFGQATEEAALKATVQAQTKAWIARDGEATDAVWLHDDKATRATVFAGNYGFTHGSQEILANAAKDRAENPKPLRLTAAIENFVARQEGNLAFVEFDEHLTGPDVDPSPSQSHEYRLLVKQGGQWKIASQITHDLASFGNSPEAIESRVNAVGYSLLASGKPQDAVELLKVNVRMYPQWWNAYDSLGEAYAASGQKDLAIQNYEKSVQLNPKNDNGRQALAKLKAQ